MLIRIYCPKHNQVLKVSSQGHGLELWATGEPGVFVVDTGGMYCPGDRQAAAVLSGQACANEEPYWQVQVLEEARGIEVTTKPVKVLYQSALEA